jgi:tryptophan synthase alpha chain
MNPIDSLFQSLRSQRRKAFIPFVSAGDPDIATTAKVIQRLAEAGANLIEIGFPYSDPIADGPVIQASFTRALDEHIQVDDVFGCIRRLSDDPAWRARQVPLVGMLSYSLVYRRGPEKFIEQSQAAGLSGLIVPDLPIDEAEPLVRLAAARDFKLIHLVTPTTPPERAARIARLSTGFLYVVSITGITGERDRLPDEVHAQLQRLRGVTELPLCIGFGISTPEHVRLLRDEVDGVIVGSAIVRRLAEARQRRPDEVVEEIGALARSLVAALNP